MPTTEPEAVRLVTVGEELRAMPKSTRYTKSPAVTRMFDGFTSRCTRPSAWAASRALATCSTMRTALAGSMGRSRITSERSAPSTRRMSR
ncbi:hypothetical protein BBK82_34280 [Lentzea guizhouensis]|uniref:Uncharacterized protein n=1 Tax=Lentzea guizhouensis TaxID=1586287 RepID=A0A1B2HRI6_9PSEU|nr:hypothetical protein BBK82_34280 [Lentzea guizhouensis]